MKSLKIWSLVAMLFFGLTSCETPDNGGTGNGGGNSVAKDIVDEWALVSWSDTDPVFNVYVDFNEDGTFEMYQQVYSLTYELYSGNYAVMDGVLNGSYSDGEAWKCGYTATVDVDENGVKRLTLLSQEEPNITSIYTAKAIPEEVKVETTETRSVATERFL